MAPLVPAGAGEDKPALRPEPKAGTRTVHRAFIVPAIGLSPLGHKSGGKPHFASGDRK
jgi:hypothetical protein